MTSRSYFGKMKLNPRVRCAFGNVFVLRGVHSIQAVLIMPKTNCGLNQYRLKSRLYRANMAILTLLWRYKKKTIILLKLPEIYIDMAAPSGIYV